MMRGFVVVVTAILSIIFLKRVLKAFNYIGIAFVVIGIFLVGLTGFIY